MKSYIEQYVFRPYRIVNKHMIHRSFARLVNSFSFFKCLDFQIEKNPYHHNVKIRMVQNINILGVEPFKKRDH